MIRAAREEENFKIAEIIAFAYKEDFEKLEKNPEKVAAAFASGIDTSKFFVFEEDGIIKGVTAVSDISGRAVYLKPKDLRKHLGFFKAWILRLATKKEFETQLVSDDGAAVIEFVAVDEKYRGNGISGKLIKHITENSNYNQYVLDVKDTNLPAIRTYQKLGFVEYKREKVPKKYGFRYKLFMRFHKEEV